MKSASDVVLGVIKERRSVRAYTSAAVPDAAVSVMLEAAQWAPTPGNVQSWRFVVVREQLAAVKSISPGFPESASLAIVLCSDTHDMERYTEATRGIRAAEEAAMAAQNICLMAHALQLGSCVVASFSRVAIRELLRLPEPIVPTLIVALGVPKGSPMPPRRKEITAITSWEVFGGARDRA